MSIIENAGNWEIYVARRTDPCLIPGCQVKQVIDKLVRTRHSHILSLALTKIICEDAGLVVTTEYYRENLSRGVITRAEKFILTADCTKGNISMPNRHNCGSILVRDYANTSNADNLTADSITSQWLLDNLNGHLFV